jgi:HSP20 family protein
LSDPWWKRRKKKSRWFSDIYDELEKIGDMIDETMQRAFENPPEDKSVRSNRIKDFKIKIGPDGKPRNRGFFERKTIENETELGDNLEPLVDVVEKTDSLTILIALQGVIKDDIDLRVTQNCLSVSIDTDEFEWFDEFKLPTKINPKSANASFKNGVLEVNLKKIHSSIKRSIISMKK